MESIGFAVRYVKLLDLMDFHIHAVFVDLISAKKKKNENANCSLHTFIFYIFFFFCSFPPPISE